MPPKKSKKTKKAESSETVHTLNLQEISRLNSVQPVKPVIASTTLHRSVVVQPTKPLQPAIPVQPAKPLQPAIPVQPAKPLQPAIPVQPAKPLQPAIPVQPIKPLPPVENAHVVLQSTPTSGPLSTIETLQSEAPVSNALHSKFATPEHPESDLEPQPDVNAVVPPSPVFISITKSVSGSEPTFLPFSDSSIKVGNSNANAESTKQGSFISSGTVILIISILGIFFFLAFMVYRRYGRAIKLKPTKRIKIPRIQSKDIQAVKVTKSSGPEASGPEIDLSVPVSEADDTQNSFWLGQKVEIVITPASDWTDAIEESKAQSIAYDLS